MAASVLNKSLFDPTMRPADGGAFISPS